MSSSAAGESVSDGGTTTTSKGAPTAPASASTVVVGTDDDNSNSNSNEELLANLSLDDIVEKRSDRGIPIAKFVDDVQQFSDSFTPVPASPEHMIGAYDQLHGKYRQYESAFRQRMLKLQDKIPELEKSIALIGYLHQKQKEGAESGRDDDHEDTSTAAICTVRYSLADAVYGRADVNVNDKTVYLWLGANVMLEYSYDDALQFLQSNLSIATRDVQQLHDDVGLVRDQIVTCEVTMSRIYNWDVRRRRELQQQQQQQQPDNSTSQSQGGAAIATAGSKA